MSTFVAPTTVRRVDVTGTDRLNYLEDVTTQRLADASAGDVRGTLYLDVHGAPVAMFDVAVLADRLALLVPGGDLAETVVEVLGGRTFLLDAAFSLTDDQVLAVRGEDVEAAAAGAGVPVPPDGTVRPAGDGLYLVGRPGGFDVVGPAEAVARVGGGLEEAGARAGTADDLEAWRVSAGLPAWGVEVTGPHLPEELGLLPTHVHLAKGCYPGQEAVARMWMLGRPRRRLAVVRPKDADLVPGWETGEGRRRVQVTSVAADGSAALAFVPGDVGEGEVLGDNGAGVEVVRLIGADDDPPGADPAVTRRRDRR